MRKLPLLTLALGVTLAALLIDGHAGRNILQVRVRTAATDVVVTPSPEGTTVTAHPSASALLVPLQDAGKPAVPFRIVEVLIPSGERVIGVTASARAGETLARGVTPALVPPPSPQPDAPRSMLAPAESPPVAPENGGDVYPSELVRYLGTGTWHGYAIASFAVFPVSVAGGGVTLHTDIDVRVELAAAPDAHAPTRIVRANRRAASEIASRVNARVENADAMSSYPSPRATDHAGAFAPSSLPSEDGSPVDYLIITTAALAPSFQVLADWKTAKGVATVVRTVDWIEANSRNGSDLAETIRFFLQDAYANWGIRYLLLAGDTPEVPPRFLYSGYYYGGTDIPADIYFACLDGSYNADGDTRFGEQPADAPDLYPELFVGRLPVSDAEDADVVVGKIIGYETPTDVEFTDKVLMLAEVLFPAPWSSGEILLNGGDVTDVPYTLYVNSPDRRTVRMYETPWLYPGSVQESRALAIDSLEAGFNQVFHVGHGFRFNMHCGDDNVAIPDADALLHPDRFFNLYMLNCTAAAFDYDCLGEHMLRNPVGGAVSIVGAVNSAFAQVSAAYLDLYARKLYQDDIVRVGETLAASRSPRTPLAMLGDNVDLWTHYIYTLLGDPEQPIWTARARTPEVALPDSVPAGDSAIQVVVTVEGQPAAGALVCLSKDGEDYRVGETDAGGVVTLFFTAPTAGVIDVVVTGFNLARTTASIPVTGALGPVLKVGVVSIDDDTVDGTVGNGDGLLDAGETVDLFPTLQNFTADPTAEMTLVLASSSPHVSVIDPIAQVGTVAANGSAVATDAWRVSIAPTAPDVAPVSFEVSITDGVFAWTDAFARVVHAPTLEVTGLRTSDAPPLGDGDGVLEAGEEFRLFATIKNFGSGSARGLSGVLRSQDGGATVIDSLDTFADAPPLVAVENAVGFRLSEANVAIENSLELVVSDARGVELQHLLELRGPAPPVIQSFNPGLGVDKMGLAWNASTSPDAHGYHVYRATALAGPFVRVSADVVLNTLFTDAGLTASTRYYYAVTTVDDAGNESAYSPVASASTTPPQLVGWPNELVDPSANSPTLGDVDGDGSIDVVVGNDRMYAWRFDGDEVHDGDGQALTWGVLSTLGDDFIGPSALAEFNGSPGLEIVAAAYTSKQVFVFDHTGTPLPGWPQPTVDLVRASVAIGDIDGDTDFEILAIDQEGYLYAWHANGTEVIDGDADPTTNGVFRRLPDTNQWQYQPPAVADIDADGKDEVIVAAQDMKLYVLNEVAADEPGWPRTLPNFPGGGVVVGDIDDDGDLEIVVTTRNTGETYALHHDNTVMWQRWLQTNLFFNPCPALADLTGDGKLEALVPSSNGRMYAVQFNGTDAPGWPVVYSTTAYTESSPVVADVDGDGVVDVLLGHEGKFITGWSALGVALEGFPLVLKDAVRGTPAVADLDYDGDVEVVAVGYDKTVYVWDLSTPFNPDAAPWPMFRANVHRNGRHGHDTPTPVSGGARAARFALGQNYPNPFNPTTTIAFDVPSTGRVSLIVYDVTGARVRTLVDQSVRAGGHRVEWDGRNDARNPVGSGVYFYRLAANGAVLTKKMVLLK
ncbi:MAG: C25 family cysteine peptidase [Candidatus Latescibacteria bacterium]|nr:C25 family cysteine peptidase [Candidatus Latescibacterota bacterium]